MDFLRDPIVLVVLTVLLLIVTVAPWVSQIRERPRKALVWRLVLNSPLVTTDEKVRNKFTILFDGTPVRNLNALVIEFANAGNVPIEEDDFKGPIKISFGQQAVVLRYGQEAEPKHLVLGIETTRDGVLIQPVLLNQRDKVRVSLVVKDFGDQIDVSSRIVGVPNIKQVGKDQELETRMRLLPIYQLIRDLSLPLGLIALVGLFLPDSSRPVIYLVLAYALAMVNSPAAIYRIRGRVFAYRERWRSKRTQPLTQQKPAEQHKQDTFRIKRVKQPAIKQVGVKHGSSTIGGKYGNTQPLSDGSIVPTPLSQVQDKIDSAVDAPPQ